MRGADEVLSYVLSGALDARRLAQKATGNIVIVIRTPNPTEGPARDSKVSAIFRSPHSGQSQRVKFHKSDDPIAQNTPPSIHTTATIPQV
jgi:hypothetical protein